MWPHNRIAVVLAFYNDKISSSSSSSSSSSVLPPNFTEDSGGDECLLVRKVGEYERQWVNLLGGWKPELYLDCR